jgi:chromosome partitioning protein
LLIGAATLLEVCIETPFNFDILPANRELAGAEVELIELDEREYRLKKPCSRTTPNTITS